MSLMTKDELGQLKDKAISYCRYGGSTECKWLYRNKSRQYFTDVLVKNGGIMEPYIKDNSGDQRSPINGRLNGLFFMARHENGEPPPSSAFGPVRLQVPARELLDRAPNLYFTDFYCMQSDWHYVTLVATSRHSSADFFCRTHLIPLSLHDEVGNKFLFYRNGQLHVSAAPRLHIELFYTDSIRVFRPGARAAEYNDIFDPDLLAFHGAQMKHVMTFGRGSSTPGGIPKKVPCQTCNLPVVHNPVNFDSFRSLLDF